MPYGGLRIWLLPLLKRRVSTVTGLANLPGRGRFLLAGNHNAWLDSPLLVGALYAYIDGLIYFIAKSRYYTSNGALNIDPHNRAAVVEAALQKLEAGNAVAVFPEGASNQAPTLLPPHTGIARLAHATGRPVVPVGIRGTWGRHPLASAVCFLTPGRQITIHLGAPLTFPVVPAGALTHELLTATSQRILAAIAPLAGKALPPKAV